MSASWFCAARSSLSASDSAVPASSRVSRVVAPPVNSCWIRSWVRCASSSRVCARVTASRASLRLTVRTCRTCALAASTAARAWSRVAFASPSSRLQQFLPAADLLALVGADAGHAPGDQSGEGRPRRRTHAARGDDRLRKGPCSAVTTATRGPASRGHASASAPAEASDPRASQTRRRRRLFERMGEGRLPGSGLDRPGGTADPPPARALYRASWVCSEQRRRVQTLPNAALAPRPRTAQHPHGATASTPRSGPNAIGSSRRPARSVASAENWTTCPFVSPRVKSLDESP
jgi:hypothetical protein